MRPNTCKIYKIALGAWPHQIFSALLISLVLLIAGPGVALAHEGQPLAPHDLWSAWNWDPIILPGLLLVGWAYGRGVQALWRRAGVGHGTSRWRVAAFAGGLLTLFIALISPLDALSGVLFSAHMVQHQLLMLVAAPLLVLGAPPVSLAWALPGGWRQPVARWWHRRQIIRAGWHGLTRPLVVWVLHAAALWLWHLPGLYQAALRSEFIHIVEHASFLGTALLFWWALAQSGGHGRLGYGAAVLYTFTMALQGGLLGSLLTFSSRLWYPDYAATTSAWGLTPLEDQQLAGVIMWVPANMIYVIAALVLLGIWLQGMEQKEQRSKSRILPLPIEQTTDTNR